MRPHLNVFITGHAGYMGSVCVEELCHAGQSVTLAGTFSTAREAVGGREGEPLIECVFGQEGEAKTKFHRLGSSQSHTAG